MLDYSMGSTSCILCCEEITGYPGIFFIFLSDKAQIIRVD